MNDEIKAPLCRHCGERHWAYEPCPKPEEEMQIYKPYPGDHFAEDEADETDD